MCGKLEHCLVLIDNWLYCLYSGTDEYQTGVVQLRYANCHHQQLAECSSCAQKVVCYDIIFFVKADICVNFFSMTNINTFFATEPNEANINKQLF